MRMCMCRGDQTRPGQAMPTTKLQQSQGKGAPRRRGHLAAEPGLHGRQLEQDEQKPGMPCAMWRCMCQRLSVCVCVWERALDAINERIFNLTWCDKADQVATQHRAATVWHGKWRGAWQARTDLRFALANRKPHSGVHTNVAGQQHRSECHSPE